jgi:hypothetical protein
MIRRYSPKPIQRARRNTGSNEDDYWADQEEEEEWTEDSNEDDYWADQEEEEEEELVREPPELPDVSWMTELDPGKRYTFTASPITGVRNMTGEQSVNDKPRGMWYSCGDGWIQWLMAEMPKWIDDIKYVYEVVPNLEDMFQLRTERDIFSFSNEVGVTQYGRRANKIDWQKVARMSSGIEICPYQYNLRIHHATPWYYPWDYASGCIWHPNGLRSLRIVAQRKA